MWEAYERHLSGTSWYEYEKHKRENSSGFQSCQLSSYRWLETITYGRCVNRINRNHVLSSLGIQCHTFSWQSLNCSMEGLVNRLHSLQFESSYCFSWYVQEWQLANLWRGDFSYVDNFWRWSQALLCIHSSYRFRFQTLLIWQICNEWKLSKLFSSITRSGKQIQQKHQSRMNVQRRHGNIWCCMVNATCDISMTPLD